MRASSVQDRVAGKAASLDPWPVQPALLARRESSRSGARHRASHCFFPASMPGFGPAWRLGGGSTWVLPRRTRRGRSGLRGLRSLRALPARRPLIAAALPRPSMAASGLGHPWPLLASFARRPCLASFVRCDGKSIVRFDPFRASACNLVCAFQMGRSLPLGLASSSFPVVLRNPSGGPPGGQTHGV